MLVQKASSGSGSDVFEKIKEMVAGLIKNLQKQAQDSQTKKAYCNKGISESSATRDKAAGKVKFLNNELVSGESRRDTLVEDITLLTQEMAQQAAEKNTATAIRNQKNRGRCLD